MHQCFYVYILSSIPLYHITFTICAVYSMYTVHNTFTTECKSQNIQSHNAMHFYTLFMLLKKFKVNKKSFISLIYAIVFFRYHKNKDKRKI